MLAGNRLDVVYEGHRSGLFKAAARHQAVRDVTIEVAPGEVVALVGESGSGKTSVARVLAGLRRPNSGDVTMDGQPVEARARLFRSVPSPIQLVFQDPYTALDPRLPIGRSLMEPLHGLAREQRRAKVEAIIERIGLTISDLDRRPATFSGGQRQRICLARAVVVDPPYLICDEPTSALDASTRNEMLRLIQREATANDRGVLLVTHDLSAVAAIASQVAVMQNGVIVEAGAAKEILARPKNPYTRQLLDASRALHPTGSLA